MEDSDKRLRNVYLMPRDEEDPWRSGSPRDLGWRVLRHSQAWRPPTDVLETEQAYVVLVEVAGMRGAEFTVIFESPVLSIRGVRSDANVRKAYHQMEIDYGEFATEVQVPVKIDAEHIQASYSDGFLRVTLPKARAKRVPIDDQP